MTTQDDWIFATPQPRHQAGMTLVATRGADPDVAARANVLARQLGLPPVTVERNYAELAGMHRAEQARERASLDDYLSRWLSEPRNAAAASDDADPLARIAQGMRRAGILYDPDPARRRQERGAGISRTLNPSVVPPPRDARTPYEFNEEAAARIRARAFGRQSAIAESRRNVGWWQGTTVAATEGWRQAWIGAQMYVGDMLGFDMSVDLERQMRRSQERVFAHRPIMESLNGNALFDAVVSLENMVPALIVGALTGGQGVLPFMGIQSGLSAYPRYRVRGASAAEALLGATIEGGTEVITERFAGLPSLFTSFGRRGGTSAVMGYLGRDYLGEQAATLIQDAADTAIANPDATWEDYWSSRLERGYSTLIGSVVATGGIGGLHYGVSQFDRPARRLESFTESLASNNFMEQFMESAEASQLRQRDPEAFRQYVEGLTNGTAAENLYIPAEAVRSLNQDYREDPFFAPYADRIDEALATGTDVVIPTSAAAAGLAGTDHWQQLREHARFTPGGMSKQETAAVEASFLDDLERAGAEIAEQVRREQGDIAPAQRVFETMRDKLMQAGYRPDVASDMAAVWASRQRTRAERLGRPMTGAEADTVSVQQVLPEKLATAIRAADAEDIGLRALINEMRRERGQRGDKAKFGPSLSSFIRGLGGIEDRGGDLEAMGAQRVTGRKPGAPRLIRPHIAGQASMLGSDGGQNTNSPDNIALAAWEAGYFPEFSERPSVNDLLDAIADEIAGRPRFAEDRTSEQDDLREAADELFAILDQQGVDPASATEEEIQQVMRQYQSERAQGWSYEQAQRAIGRVLEAASETGNRREVATIGPVSEWLTDQAKQAGLDIRGYAHTVDSFAVRHIRKSHGDPATEAERGQVAITDADLLAIPELLASPDSIIFGTQNRLGLEQIAYLKRMPDGSTLYLEEVRTGRHHVAAQSMRKYPPTMNAASIVATLDPNAQGDREAELKIIDVPEDIKANGERSLDQSFGEGPRGRVTFTKDGRSVVELFENRDLSTFIHETGHIFLEELKADAALPDAPDQLKQDWQAVVDWFATSGHQIGEDGIIPTEAHELWARGFERFTMEGKAPSTVLKRAFEAMRSWLLTIYQVVENLRSPITNEVRDVMTRMLATDQEIEIAQAEQATKALFTSAEQAAELGISADDYANMESLAAGARTEAFEALLYRTMASIRAARTQEWKERERGVRTDVATAIDDMPVFQALRLLRTGKINADDEARPVKLDRLFLLNTYGAAALDSLPKSVPPIYGDKNLVHPDVIAEEVGFNSGDEMIRTLMGHEDSRRKLREQGDSRSVRKAMIDERVAERMAERYGDPLRDGSIEEEALAAVHNDRQGDLIEAELKALHRLRFASTSPNFGRPTPYAAAREWAANKIKTGKVSEVASGAAIQMYERAARKAGRAAESAIAQRDVDETYRQKQFQMMNNALVSEARKAKDLVDAAVKRLGNVASKRTMGSVDQDYLEQAHELLERYDFKARSLRDVSKQIAFEEWAEQRRAEGYDVLVPPRYQDRMGRRHWSQLSVEEIAGLDDTVKQIIHLGRMKQTLLDGQERRAYEEARAELIASADSSSRRRKVSDLNDPTRSLPERIKSHIRMADAAMVKVEQLVDWMDGGNSNGPWNRLIFRPMADAQGREGDMLREYTRKMEALVGTVPKEQLRQWGRLVETPELIDRVSADPALHGRPFRFGKDQVIMIAMNWGNAGNRQRLVDGYGWTEEQVEAALDRHMTAEDWAFVQGTWDIIDEFRKPLFEVERRVNGVEPEAIEAVEVQTRHGTFRGGYFPAMYDSAYSTAAERNEAEKMLGGGFFRATTRASATKARAEQVKRPILLHTSAITAHVREVIHDITHREAVIQVNKLLSDGKVRAALNRNVGPEYTKAAEAWLEDIASPNAANAQLDPMIRTIGRHLHKGVTLAGLGYRVSTMLLQPLGLANMAGVVGERAVAEGMAKFTANPFAAYREVTEKSAEMRDRFTTMDASIADMYGDRAANKLMRFGPSAFERHAFSGILFFDMTITVGGWIGAYNKGLREGMGEQDAIYYADKIVRTSQGAGGTKDRSSILRANHLVRSFYAFFSYMNALYNQQRDIGRRARNAESVGDVAETVRRAWWIMVVPSLAQALLFGDGPDEDDEEGWAAYLGRSLLVSNLGSVPLIGGIASAIGNGWDYRASTIQRVGEGVIRAQQDATADNGPRQGWIANVFDTIGVVTAKPLSAPGRAVQFGADVMSGEAEPESVGDVFEGVTTGRIREER